MAYLPTRGCLYRRRRPEQNSEIRQPLLIRGYGIYRIRSPVPVRTSCTFFVYGLGDKVDWGFVGFVGFVGVLAG